MSSLVVLHNGPEDLRNGNKAADTWGFQADPYPGPHERFALTEK